MKGPLRGDRPLFQKIQHIELSENRVKLRIALLIAALLVAAVSFAYGINALLSTEPGLQEITVLSGSGLSCADSFTLYYNLGAGEESATAERKNLRGLYTQAAGDAYRIFVAGARTEKSGGLAYLNGRVNLRTTVDGSLYQALTLLAERGQRRHYLAPVYALYESLFQCASDSETGDYDPAVNPALGAYCQEVLRFAKEPESVEVELLGDNTVCLRVSEEYLGFARDNGITRFVDFFWMENAFAADYIAAALETNGYTRGTLVSRDGFIRSLDSTTAYDLPFYHRSGREIAPVDTLRFSGPVSIVCLRDYPAQGEEQGRYYVREDGVVRTAFVDPADGLCKSALPEMAAFSVTRSCGEIAAALAPVYIADSFDEAALWALVEEDVAACYWAEGALRRSDGKSPAEMQ